MPVLRFRAFISEIEDGIKREANYKCIPPIKQFNILFLYAYPDQLIGVTYCTIVTNMVFSDICYDDNAAKADGFDNAGEMREYFGIKIKEDDEIQNIKWSYPLMPQGAKIPYKIHDTPPRADHIIDEQNGYYYFVRNYQESGQCFFKNISAALSVIQLKTITRYANDLYTEYINNLVNNLKTISNNSPSHETEKAVFMEVKGKIPPSNWSDTASFSAVNELFNPGKILFLGGLEKKSGTIKLSIRCSRKYLIKNEDNGVNSVISRIKKELGGVGGGHKLAGGIRLSIPSYNRLKKDAKDFI